MLHRPETDSDTREQPARRQVVPASGVNIPTTDQPSDTPEALNRQSWQFTQPFLEALRAGLITTEHCTEVFRDFDPSAARSAVIEVAGMDAATILMLKRQAIYMERVMMATFESQDGESYSPYKMVPKDAMTMMDRLVKTFATQIPKLIPPTRRQIFEDCVLEIIRDEFDRDQQDRFLTNLNNKLQKAAEKL